MNKVNLFQNGYVSQLTMISDWITGSYNQRYFTLQAHRPVCMAITKT